MSSNTPSSKSTTSPSLQAAILRFKLSLNKDLPSSSTHSLPITSSSSSPPSSTTDDSQFDLNFSNRGNKLHFNSDNVDYTKLNSYRDDLNLSIINQYDQFNPGDNNPRQRLIITSKKASIDDIIRRQIDSEFGNDYKHTKRLKSGADSDDDDDDYNEDEDDEYTDSARDLLNSIDVAGILGPILKPTDIVKRKSIEDIYTSNHLSRLSEEIIHLVEKEQNNVNQLSKLMNVFLGDNPNDLLADNLLLPKYDHSLDIDEQIKKEDVTNGGAVQKGQASITNNHPVDNDQPKSKRRKTSTPQPKDVDTTQEEEDEDHDANSKTNNDNAPSSSSSSSAPKITNETINKSIKDPFFQLPEYKKDFNFGVSKIEHAEESRQLIQIALQRNEEFIRSLTSIRNGFIRADRLKNNIYKWCREMHEDEEMESQNRVVSNSISSTTINNANSTNGDSNNINGNS